MNDLFHRRWFLLFLVFLFATLIYLGCVVSPPSLMDDVDAIQALIAKTMATSGDYVTARLDGVVYLEKAPLIYWLMAASYKVFGFTDWAVRLPVALASIALALLSSLFGMWAFGKRAGFYAGLCIATCVGLFLFTRIQIPDVMLTFTIALALWAFLRALDEEEQHPRLWAAILAASLGTGLLLKSLVGIVFPVAAALIYLSVSKQLFSRRTWRRLRPVSGSLIVLLIAVPWHVLATLRNPPYFAWTLKSGPGLYHGFLWFYFVNEQLLRFLNLRYPRDYNTVPRLYFWLFHFIWLFPWSVYLPAVAKLSFKPVDRAGQVRLLATLLDGVHSHLLHLLNDSGILLHAVLSGLGASAGLGHGDGRQVDPSRDACFGSNRCARWDSLYRHCIRRAQFAHSGRYFLCPIAASFGLHALARAFAGCYLRFLRLSSSAALPCRGRFFAGSRG